MRLILIRHAETEWNKLKKFSGWIPEIGLTTEGKKQARLTAERLKNLKLDYIYSSPLLRAYKTAKIISEYLKVPLLMAKGFTEWKMGEWDGKTENYIKTHHPNEWFFYINKPLQLKIKDAEKLIQVQKRVIEEIKELEKGHNNDKNLLIVSHADIIKIVLIYFLNMDLEWMHCFKIDNCSLTILRIKPTIQLELFNDRSHLF